jgi:hypothetical protein
VNCLELPGWLVYYDRDATIQALARVPAGGADSCTCEHCQNWVLTRERVVSKGMETLLHELGIPLDRDVEVCHTCRVRSGIHLYTGWFHLVGRIEFGYQECSQPANVDGFNVWFSGEPALVPDELNGLALIQLEFDAEIPWLSSLPEPSF